MASTAEQMAANMNMGSFAKAKELQKRILFTLGALIAYRLGTYIPLPGVDLGAFRSAFDSAQHGILGMFNMFAGGAVERMAIFALNVMPYISASIIMQLVIVGSPALQQLKKEGESGRTKLNQYTRYLTVMIAAVQGYGISVGLESANVVIDPGIFFRLSVTITLIGGTLFLMWLGEQITDRGVGNGVSLIIFAGIVAELPRAILQTLSLGRSGSLSLFAILMIISVSIGVILLICFVERSQRRLLVQYPKRQVGNRIYGGETSFLPMKINIPGVIPPIFASSLLLLPATIAGFSAQSSPEWFQQIVALLGRGQPLFISVYAIGVIFFSYFYAPIVFNPEETAENLKNYGGFLPGIRPGARTAEYLSYVLYRLTFIGALYLAFVSLLPEVLIAYYKVPFYIGGTSLLIVVSVTIDTVSQIQSHLVAHQYDGLIKKSRLRGRRK